jgi:antitoxin ChpS
MHTTNLRKVGGSIMLTIPPALLDILQLRPGSTVGVSVDQGRLVVEPRMRPRYTLEELLAQCDASAEPSEEDRQWASSPPAGRELI